MPEYLAPGVYVEETSFRSKSIEGVSTTTTGFVGPTRYGPIGIEPEIVTSLAEFERIYGDRNKLSFSDGTGNRIEVDNFMWHGVRTFFEEGGKRLYISRVFHSDGKGSRGYASAKIPVDGSDDNSILFKARFPGESGKMKLLLTLRLGQNIFNMEPVPDRKGKLFKPAVKSLVDRDVVCISQKVSTSPQFNNYYIARATNDSITKEPTWIFERITAPPTSPSVETRTLGQGTYKEGSSGWDPDPPDSPPLHSPPLISDLDPNTEIVRVVTLTVTVMQGDFAPAVFEGLPLDPDHARAAQRDSFFDIFAERPATISQARRLPIIIKLGEKLKKIDGTSILEMLFNYQPELSGQLEKEDSTDFERSILLELIGGDDGIRPDSADYEGEIDPATNERTGLKVFEDIDDISIIAAPGATYGYAENENDVFATVKALITHAENMRYRIAVLDSGNKQIISEVRALRARLDSSHAALYYPWVKVLDPVTRTELDLPPSGFIAGIYARNDTNRAVYKAPANEVVNLAIGFETLLNRSQQEVLNPEGINCFRYFEGRGFRLWGARTASSDPEWKYVNLRRYFAYLEHSIDKGTQWAVFEPNGDMLWANVRRTVEDFLLNEWQSGALLGEKPDKAYFVRCDRSTMTQNDLDNGRLICLVGVAPLRPAEFVIFRIGQWTSDRKI